MNIKLKKVVGIILVAIVVLGAISAWILHGAAWQVAHLRRAMRAQGFKTDLADFNYTNDAATQARVAKLMGFKGWPELLNSENDEVVFLPAATNSAATVLWKLDSLKVGTNIIHWSVLHAILDPNLRALDSACDAALAGPIRFGRDASRGIQMFGLEPMCLQNLSELLDLRILLELHEGNPEAAWTNLLAATRLVTAYENEPTRLSQYVKVGMAGTAFAEAWQVLQQGNWPEEKLAALQQEWESADFFTNMIESTAIDYTNDVYSCQHLTLPWGSFSLSTLVGQFMVERAIANQEIKDRVAFQIYRQRDLLADEKGVMLYFQRRALELRRALQATNWAEMRALPGVTKVVQYVSSNRDAESALGENHSFDNSMLAFAAVAEAQRRVIVTAIALERYRGKHGAYPGTLVSLAPEFLKAVPEDFMDSQPLRFQLTEDGHFVLYSVGLDCKDHGGIVSQDIWQGTGGPTNEDIVWPRPEPVRVPANRP